MNFSTNHDHSSTALLSPASRSASPSTRRAVRDVRSPARDSFERAESTPRAAFDEATPNESPEETRRLLARFRDGDRMAGDALVLRYRDRLCRYVLIRSGARRRHSLDVEDVIHDAYVKLLEKIDEFEYRGKDSLYAYLRSIADRLVLDRWRTAGERRRESGESAERIIEELLSRDPDPSDSEEARELEELLDACVAALPAKYREVILNRYYLGGSAREVAEWLGYSNAHAVETLCGRAKAKLIRIAATRLGRRLESA